MPLFPDLRARHRRPEIMDGPGLDVSEHERALAALGLINRLSLGDRAVWPAVRRFARARRDLGDRRPVRLLDVATGGGDLPVRLKERAEREGIALDVAGCDRSPVALAYATRNARKAGVDAVFFEHDALEGPLPPGYDVLTSSLFLHHLDGGDALAFLRSMGDAGELVLIDDLTRGVLGWFVAYAGVRVLSRSSVAHTDGPRSVEGAFTPAEALDLARGAGWTNAAVRRRPPFRFLLTGVRSGRGDNGRGD